MTKRTGAHGTQEPRDSGSANTLPSGRFYRFEHIATYISGKVVAKWTHPVGKLNSIITNLARGPLPILISRKADLYTK